MESDVARTDSRRAGRASSAGTVSRRVAMETIGQVLGGSGKLTDVLHERAAARRISDRDKRLAYNLAAGSVRRLLTLDTILDVFCKRDEMETPVRHILRIGLYQLLFCDGIPARAAVNESVELMRETGPQRAGGFVNAVLRSIMRDFRMVETADIDRRRAVMCGPSKWALFGREIFPDPNRSSVSYISRQLSHPEWLVRRWVARYGADKTWGLCLAGNEEAPLFLRPNSPRADVNRLVELLAAEGIQAVVSESGRTVRLPSGVNTESLRVLRDGYCVVQDDSASGVVPFLAPTKGARALDLCAAPGGKMAQLSEAVGENGNVVAVDNDHARLGRLFENIERLGLGNVAVVEADGRSLPSAVGKFDYVLVDAPCSNTAVLRRRFEARWRVTEAGLADLNRLQYALALSGARALKPGGKMVFSTCTLEPEENQNVLTAVAAADVQMAMEEERQLFPTIGGGDGAYMARLVKRA